MCHPYLASPCGWAGLKECYIIYILLRGTSKKGAEGFRGMSIQRPYTVTAQSLDSLSVYTVEAPVGSTYLVILWLFTLSCRAVTPCDVPEQDH